MVPLLGLLEVTKLAHPAGEQPVGRRFSSAEQQVGVVRGRLLHVAEQPEVPAAAQAMSTGTDSLPQVRRDRGEHT